MSFSNPSSSPCLGVDDNKNKNKSGLPSHPTARAFFAALDDVNNDDDGSKNTNANRRRSSRQSDIIKKRCHTLGWRNRFSQDEYYPIILQVEQENFKFSVHQIQRGEVEGTYGTGATVWPAAVVLLKYLERNRHIILQKMVVDLGSGTGITSIGAAILEATHVICTDGCAKVVQLAKDNISKVSLEMAAASGKNSNDHKNDNNGSGIVINGCRIDVEEYWWGSSKKLSGREMNCDVVLVADCVLPKLYPIGPLVQAIDKLLIKPTSMAILSYEHRYYPEYDPRDYFQKLANERGLTVHVIPMKDQDHIYSVEDIEIWHVYRHRDAGGAS